MTVTLLNYLVKCNPTVIAPAQKDQHLPLLKNGIWLRMSGNGPSSTMRRSPRDLEKIFSAKFPGSMPQANVKTEVIATYMNVGYAILYACLSPVLYQQYLVLYLSCTVSERLGCFPDWGTGHEMSPNENGRARALALGDTKFKCLPTNAISTVVTRVDDSYKDAPMRDDVRPFEQAQYMTLFTNANMSFLSPKASSWLCNSI